MLDKLDEFNDNNGNGIQLSDVVNEMDVNNVNDPKVNTTTLNNWKWNYLHDNVSQRNELQSKMAAARDAASENSSKLPTEHSFCTNFDEFALSLMQKESPEYMNFDIRETDLLETDDSDKTGDIRETSLTGSDDEGVKETDLTGISDDEFTDVSSLSSLTIRSGLSGLSLNRLNSSFISIPNGHEDGKSDIFGNTPRLDLDTERSTDSNSNNDIKSSKGGRGESVKFQDLESDYFETDCETMDSGIFPNKNAEYFQDIGSDFFDDEGDDENENENEATEKSSQLLRTKKKRDKKNSENSLSPLSPLPPGKTASISNSLLRSTISELERALGDSNKLLAKRDAKMQIVRNRNIELKKTLAKEIETNTKMKHMLVEKDKVILEKQTKIIELNQEIHDINDKLSKLRLNRLNEIHSSAPMSEKLKLGSHETSFDEKSSVNGDVEKVKTPTKNDVAVVTTPTTPGCKSSNRRSFCREKNTNNSEYENKSKDSTPETDNKHEYMKNNNENANHNNDAIIKKDDVNSPDVGTQGNELQANLRIKFLRDAFFYYMIGFHPDEQINAILAILEYGDRRQDFVLEAHNMKKTGKKFNVSKVSSRGHSFVQEEFH